MTEIFDDFSSEIFSKQFKLNHSCDEWRMDGTTMLPRFFSIRKSTYWKNFWWTEIEQKENAHTYHWTIWIVQYIYLWLICEWLSICEFKSCSDEANSIKHYVIKFVSDLWQFCGFLHQTDRHDITEILLKVALNTKTPT